MLDAFVLLVATDEGRAEHHDALTIMNEWAAGDTTLCTSGQILREYLAVATRPAGQNGLGLKFGGRNRQRAGHPRADRLPGRRRQGVGPPPGTAGRLGKRGKQVHDANVVATMLAHGVPRLSR
jgi:predicted nucleic acid-binding protein